MFFIRLFSHLPWSILYCISDLLFLVSYYLIGYRKDVVLYNLALAFPEKNDAERRAIAKDFYKHLCDIIVEIVKTLTISQEDLQRRIYIENPEVLGQYLTNGQSCIVVAGHISHWEWTPAIIKLRFPQYSIMPVYKTLSNAFSDRLVLQIRSRFGVVPITKENVLREVVRRKKNGEIFCLGLVADQSPAGHEIDFKTNFFNIPTYFYTGADKLSRQTGFPVVYSEVERLARGKYVLRLQVIEPQNNHPNEIIERYAQLLETSIRKHPAHWLWSHKRWKFLNT
ncbi:MAG: lysophospholipid acyltransferase family protein [Cytophagales bacterium]|nr:lysophospholipid acyltransferase family protein [Bernardetiaceae bacterium]MDW8205359.1 lysophospholipid acyltransferase family protein [Cytophagales bacterium]